MLFVAVEIGIPVGGLTPTWATVQVVKQTQLLCDCLGWSLVAFSAKATQQANVERKDEI